MLIEDIAAYAEQAKMIAEGAYAERLLLEGPQSTLPGGRVDASAMAVLTPPPLSESDLRGLEVNGKTAQFFIPSKIDDIARLVGRIETYLAQ